METTLGSFNESVTYRRDTILYDKDSLNILLSLLERTGAPLDYIRTLIVPSILPYARQIYSNPLNFTRKLISFEVEVIIKVPVGNVDDEADDDDDEVDEPNDDDDDDGDALNFKPATCLLVQALRRTRFLPLKKRRRLREGLSSMNKECAICLNEFSEGDKVASICTHVFHDGCIVKWLKTSHQCRNPTCPLLQVRDHVTNLCINILLSYRKFCATVPSTGQLILPEALKLLPLHTLALIKSRGLRNDGRIDDRSFWFNYVSSLSTPLAIPLVYPRVFAIHNVDSKLAYGPKCFNHANRQFMLAGQDGESVLPPTIPLSSEHACDDGIYLLENGEDALIYFGSSMDSSILQQLFGFTSVDEVPTQLSHWCSGKKSRVQILDTISPPPPYKKYFDQNSHGFFQHASYKLFSTMNVVCILDGRRQECKWAILCGVSCTYSSANPNENVSISFKRPQQQVFNFDLGFCMKKKESEWLPTRSFLYIYCAAIGVKVLQNVLCFLQLTSQVVMALGDQKLHTNINLSINKDKSLSRIIMANILGHSHDSMTTFSGMVFVSCMVEDKNNANGLSYVEFLVHIHRQIQMKIFKLPQQQVFSFDLGFCMKKKESEWPPTRSFLYIYCAVIGVKVLQNVLCFLQLASQVKPFNNQRDCKIVATAASIYRIKLREVTNNLEVQQHCSHISYDSFNIIVGIRFVSSLKRDGPNILLSLLEKTGAPLDYIQTLTVPSILSYAWQIHNNPLNFALEVIIKVPVDNVDDEVNESNGNDDDGDGDDEDTLNFKPATCFSVQSDDEEQDRLPWKKRKRLCEGLSSTNKECAIYLDDFSEGDEVASMPCTLVENQTPVPVVPIPDAMHTCSMMVESLSG
ncbi:hypothetical protein CXB51_011324 [Gossypium anomalum]|uniref:RING-type domain-containing protein n=1 Tax=Gossypium anomalum TaxID=47600 RepID=A0A8J5ZPE6_9ROSI|nr:hypothetical protein CXB51_011324 [Gossypium anomalum]